MPDTLTMSRTAPAPDVPAAFASSERAALAAAIDRHRQLSAHLADTRQRAQAGIDARLRQALQDRDAAEAALREAEAAASSRALARALGDAGIAGATELRTNLETARQRFDDAHRDRELVAAEIERLSRSVDGARQTRDEAVSKVLSATPGWVALMAELPAARLRVQRLENLFDVLSNLPGTRMPAHWGTPMLRDRPQSWLPDPALAASWTEAITALQSDATAVLPGDVD
jgi:outer membrane PBP1 activator LpoA protein